MALLGSHHSAAQHSTQWSSHPNLPWPKVRFDLFLVDIAEALGQEMSKDLSYRNGADTIIWFLQSHQCSLARCWARNSGASPHVSMLQSDVSCSIVSSPWADLTASKDLFFCLTICRGHKFLKLIILIFFICYNYEITTNTWATRWPFVQTEGLYSNNHS